jgi:hypothetical protein
VAFDATVLCRALLNPRAIVFELLIRAAQGMPFAGFTTEVVGMEFLRNAYGGFGAGDRWRTYSEQEIEGFLDVFAPLFGADNIRSSPLGRALTPDHALTTSRSAQSSTSSPAAGTTSCSPASRPSPPSRPDRASSTSTRTTCTSRSPPCSRAPTTSARRTRPTTRWSASGTCGSSRRSGWPTSTACAESRAPRPVVVPIRQDAPRKRHVGLEIERLRLPGQLSHDRLPALVLGRPEGKKVVPAHANSAGRCGTTAGRAPIGDVGSRMMRRICPR